MKPATKASAKTKAKPKKSATRPTAKADSGRKVLNVGGNSKAIAIPAWYKDHAHLLMDIDPAGKPDILGDARELGAGKAGQYDAIYCSHNLEHYSAHDVTRVLAGFAHVLRPDGFAEIRVPDMDLVLKTYVEKNMDIEDVLYQSPAGPIMVRDVIYGYGRKIAESGADFYAHKTGFTFKSLGRALLEAGFKTVVRRPGRVFEVMVFAFREPPGDYHQDLLGFRLQAPAPAGA